MKSKRDIEGNIVVVSGSILSRYDNNQKIKSITLFTNEEDAEKEFKRITNIPKKKGRTPIYKTPQAKVYYGQLIIQC